MNLSDLVLIFFDARHPEPGAMHDTLEHLVENTINRPDPGKFLYILNQMDSTAREDNPEDVVASWQRALADKGLTAGRFYTIYNPDAAYPIEDPAIRERFEGKRDADLAEIHQRMQQVEVERAYRIVGALEKHARDIGDRIVPRVARELVRWRKRVLWGDLVAAITALAAFVAISVKAGYWNGMAFQPPWLDAVASRPGALYVIVLVLAMATLGTHFLVRRLASRSIARAIAKEQRKAHERGDIAGAFLRSTSPWRSIFQATPAGWNKWTRRKIERLLLEIDQYVQSLNDEFTSPSGSGKQADKPKQPAKPTVVASQPKPDDSNVKGAA